MGFTVFSIKDRGSPRSRSESCKRRRFDTWEDHCTKKGISLELCFHPSFDQKVTFCLITRHNAAFFLATSQARPPRLLSTMALPFILPLHLEESDTPAPSERAQPVRPSRASTPFLYDVPTIQIPPLYSRPMTTVPVYGLPRSISLHSLRAFKGVPPPMKDESLESLGSIDIGSEQVEEAEIWRDRVVVWRVPVPRSWTIKEGQVVRWCDHVSSFIAVIGSRLPEDGTLAVRFSASVTRDSRLDQATGTRAIIFKRYIELDLEDETRGTISTHVKNTRRSFLQRLIGCIRDWRYKLHPHLDAVEKEFTVRLVAPMLV